MPPSCLLVLDNCEDRAKSLSRAEMFFIPEILFRTSVNKQVEVMAGAWYPPLMTHKIMIVEDNELNMKLFNDLLEAHGFETITTRDGTKAVALARETMPDLILMDIQLPEVSGLDITREIKENDQLREIPIIAVTAFAMKGDEDKIREAGCNGYISKPISISSFIEVIRNHLDMEEKE